MSRSRLRRLRGWAAFGPLFAGAVVSATAAGAFVGACEAERTNGGSEASRGFGDAPGSPATGEGEDARVPDDLEVRAVIDRELGYDDALDADSIRVEVHEGVADLSGVVDSALARRHAELLAEHVRGVRSVTNRLTVAADPRPDPELAAAVEHALEADPVTADQSIDVSAKNGHLTLHGSTSSSRIEEIAARTALAIRGAKTLESQIEVEWDEPRTEAEIANDVESRLAWDALVDDRLVDVDVEGDVVRLSGTVGSAAEKRRAMRDAWVRGAREVDAAALEVEPWIERGKLRSDKHAVRSDEAVREAVIDAMRHDPRAAASDLRVTVERGVVTVEGSVETERAKAVAVSLAKNAVGVRRVEDRTIISLEGPVSRDREDRVRRALADSSVVDADDLRLKIEGDKLIVEGEADSHFEKAEIAFIASGVEGLRVDDRVTVDGPVHASTVSPYAVFDRPLLAKHVEPVPALASPANDVVLERSIGHELAWDPLTAPWAIEVSVEDGSVTLAGSVDHAWDAARAVANAYQAGAKTVTNEITIEPG